MYHMLPKLHSDVECDGYLYILKEQNCFKKYHTQVQFWSDNQVNDNDSEDSDYL